MICVNGCEGDGIVIVFMCMEGVIFMFLKI